MIVKKCSKCYKEKEVSEFYVRSNHPHLTFGSCRVCTDDYNKKRHQKNPSQRKNSALVRIYGITSTHYDKMHENQKGLCAICGKEEEVIYHRTGLKKSLAVDHCHSNGKIRELLCSRCNLGIERFRENVDILKNAIEYLNKHNL